MTIALGDSNVVVAVSEFHAPDEVMQTEDGVELFKRGFADVAG